MRDVLIGMQVIQAISMCEPAMPGTAGPAHRAADSREADD